VNDIIIMMWRKDFVGKRPAGSREDRGEGKRGMSESWRIDEIQRAFYSEG
jgi:hypothetical protein